MKRFYFFCESMWGSSIATLNLSEFQCGYCRIAFSPTVQLEYNLLFSPEQELQNLKKPFPLRQFKALAPTFQAPLFQDLVYTDLIDWKIYRQPFDQATCQGALMASGIGFLIIEKNKNCAPLELKMKMLQIGGYKRLHGVKYRHHSKTSAALVIHLFAASND